MTVIKSWRQQLLIFLFFSLNSFQQKHLKSKWPRGFINKTENGLQCANCSYQQTNERTTMYEANLRGERKVLFGLVNIIIWAR